MSGPSPSAPCPPAARTRAGGRWLLVAGLAALAFVRVRGSWPTWIRFHGWLAERGVPHEIRNLDASIVLLAASLGAAMVLARVRLRAALGLLGLTAPVGRALLAAFLFGLPMFAASALTAGAPRASWSLLDGAALAPFVEEIFFRGLLCALLVRVAGMRFWVAAVLGGVLFGLSHVSWTTAPSAGALGIVLLTATGGVWFAWLLRCWRWNLWVPIFLHAFMNLAWLLFGVSADALGGLEANLGRAATIALATVATIRPYWLRLPREWTDCPPTRNAPDSPASTRPRRARGR